MNFGEVVAAGVTGAAFGSGGRPAPISGAGGIAISGAGGGGAASGAGGAAAASVSSSSNNKVLNSLNSNILIGINYIFTSLFIQKKREINFPPKLRYRLVESYG